MIIENINGMTVLYSESTNKITNYERTFFTDMIYLGINDSVDNYQEVGKDIWTNYVDGSNKTYAIIEERMEENEKNVKEYTDFLEDCLIDTDYRLTQHQIESDYGAVPNEI